MFNLIRNVASYATQENYQVVVDAYSRVAQAVTSSPFKVEKISASKLNSLAKCDESMLFSLYSERCSRPTFFVIYVPRSLLIFRSSDKSDADTIRLALSSLTRLINALEKGPEKAFIPNIERLRISVEKEQSFKDIHHASACNFGDAIARMCSTGDAQAIINEASLDGRFPLQIAADNDNEEALRVLVHFGADVSKQDSKLRNVLHYAAQKSPELLKLLKSSPKFATAMDQIDENGMSPLCLAIEASQIKCVKLLLDSGCSVGPFPAGPLAFILTLAHSADALPTLVDTIAEKSPHFLFERINGTSTILHEKLDRVLLYHILEGVARNLDVNVRDGLHQTPLHCAVKRGDLPQAIALLSFRADPNAMDQNGDTALHIAAQQGSLPIVKLLLCFNSSATAKNRRGFTAADIAKQSSTPHKKEIMECIQLMATPPHHPTPAPEHVISDLMQGRALSRISAMPSEQRDQIINCLSLDGGGIKGLVLIQILLHIENELGYPIMEHFKWLAGTSTGAIIALALARGDSLRTCQSLYLRLKDEIFVGKRPYSESTIEHFLQKHFGTEPTMANLNRRKVMVTATCIRTTVPELKLYRSYRLPLNIVQNEALGYSDPEDCVIWRCARYSSAAPTFFPPKDGIVDGGLIANNPTLDLLNDIHTYNAACQYSGHKEADIGCILSVGTGQSPATDVNCSTFSLTAPTSINEGISMIRDIINLKNILIEQITSSDGECVKRARSWAHDQKIAFFRLSPPLSRHVELDEMQNETIVDLLWDTEKYLRTTAHGQVQSLLAYLKAL
uniref:phospholipase A2 n=1 Tax=Ascaris suum TaxID=6253 RepID=F1KVR9_ASCSU